jgi:hypothetical protein
VRATTYEPTSTGLVHQGHLLYLSGRAILDLEMDGSVGVLEPELDKLTGDKGTGSGDGESLGDRSEDGQDQSEGDKDDGSGEHFD